RRRPRAPPAPTAPRRPRARRAPSPRAASRRATGRSPPIRAPRPPTLHPLRPRGVIGFARAGSFPRGGGFGVDLCALQPPGEVHVDHLGLRVEVVHFPPAFAVAIAGLLHPAEREVGL